MLIGLKAPALSQKGRQTGLSLVEVSITIVILGLGLTAVLGMLIASNERGADAQIRVKKVELAEAYMEEILALRFDENTPDKGGCVPFPDSDKSFWQKPSDLGASECKDISDPAKRDRCCDREKYGACPTNCGPDVSLGDLRPVSGNTDYRSTWFDVDDYHELQEGKSCGFVQPLRGSEGNELGGRYDGYCVWVKVSPSGGDLKNTPSGDIPKNDAKKVELRVAGPKCQNWNKFNKDCNNSLAFTSYKLNF